MSEIRPARELRHAKSAGEGFVNTAAFEWLSRAGFVARAAIYAIIGVLAFKLAIGCRRQAHESARRAEAPSPTSRSAHCCSRCSRSASAATRCGACSAPLSGAGPKARTPASTASRRSRAVSRTARCACSPSRSCSDPARAVAAPIRSSSAAGILGWPGGPWIVGAAGRGDDRCRALPGLQGHHAEVPRGLEDRGDEPGVRKWIARVGTVGHLARHGRFRPDRHLPGQGRDRLRPEQGRRARRRAGEAREPAVRLRACSASSPPA